MKPEIEIRADFNYLLNTAKQAAKQAARLRKVGEKIERDIETLDRIEEDLLNGLNKLTGKDFKSFAYDKNYGEQGGHE